MFQGCFGAALNCVWPGHCNPAVHAAPPYSPALAANTGHTDKRFHQVVANIVQLATVDEHSSISGQNIQQAIRHVVHPVGHELAVHIEIARFPLQSGRYAQSHLNVVLVQESRGCGEIVAKRRNLANTSKQHQIRKCLTGHPALTLYTF